MPTVPGDDIADIEVSGINDDGTLCVDASGNATLTASLTAGSTVTNPVYYWYDSDGAVAGGEDGTLELSGLTPGSYTYSVGASGDGYCETAEADRKSVTFEVLPTVPGDDIADIEVSGINDDGTLCVDASGNATLTASLTAGSTVTNPVYYWYDADGAVAGGEDGTLELSGLTPGSYTYSVGASGDGYCETAEADRKSVTFEVLPTVPGDDIADLTVETVNGDGEVCLNVNPVVTITATLASGSTINNEIFHWYDEAGNPVAGGENGVLTLDNLTAGTYTYSVGVSGDGYCETAEADRKAVTFIARDDCQLIVANDDQARTPEGTAVDIDVLANDVAGDAAFDYASVTVATGPEHGTFSVDPATGVVTYTPEAGYEGSDSFTYTVKDVDGFESNVAAVSITVGGNNGGLTANDDEAATPKDIAVNIDVLANDVAGNAAIDETSVSIVADPANGAVAVNAATGVVTYTPEAGFEGSDTFSYTMKDVEGFTSNVAFVTVTVGGTNGGLMANDDEASTIVDVPVTVDVLANDTGGNAAIDPATVTLVSEPEHGTYTVDAATGAVVYTPEAGYEGSDSFTYTVKDEDGYTSNAATVTIAVDPAPTGPIANDDMVQVNPNSFVRIAVLDNDADGSAPIDPATVNVVTEPTDGTYSVNADGTVDYIPDAGFVGEDSFEYTVADTDGRVSNVARVTLDVTSNSDLAISITVDEPTPTFDDNVVFTITVTNDGDQVFSNIIVDEALPSGYEFVDASASMGDYSPLTEKWTIGHIGENGSETLTVTAKVIAVAGAEYLNVVTIEESSPQDSNPDNNTAQVAVEPLMLIVYNEFSPNGDGFNDTFVIDGIQLYPNNTLEVYNRYGNLVFRTSGYDNDWEGIANKSGAIMEKDRLPGGTYYYVLNTGTGIKKTGWLYIAR
ncbi:hypothetical protein DN748_18625 [Sinomicrobium soli]|nr:hypothetical protein DN748_18625 [Sinomicrobium sp. N-1-3-6]